MKRMKILALFGLLLFFSISDVFAQAEVSYSGTINILVPHPNRDDAKVELSSSSFKTTITPSGNMVKTVTFVLQEGNFLIPEKGKNFISVRLPVSWDNNGEPTEYIVDQNVAVNKNGELKIILHDNGAGLITPNY